MPAYLSESIKARDVEIEILTFNLYYQNLGLISLIFLKLCAFLQRSNFGNFQQFLYYNFGLKWKFRILMVPSERSSSDLSEYILFKIKEKKMYL